MFRDLPRYADLSKTTVKWVPILPRHWELKRGKSLFKRVQREPLTSDGVVTCYRDGVVTLRSRRRSTGYTESLKEIGYQGIRKGDLVIHAMDAFAGAVGVSDSNGKGTPVYSVCIPRGEANPHYYAAVIREMARSLWITALSKGIRERSTDFRFETFGAQLLPVPPPEEQAAIVKYIDDARVRIERAIAAKRRMIALLEEQKAAIVAETLMDFKGSSRELRHVLEKLVDCEHKTAPYVEGGKHWILRTSSVKKGKIDWSGAYTTDAESFEEWTQRATPRPGDVIFTREAPVGEAAVIPSGRNVALGQRTVLMKLRKDVIVPQFLVHQIYEGLPRERIKLATQGSTVGHFNMDDIGWMRVLVPNLEEQEKAVAKIDDLSRKPHEAIMKAEREMRLLQEFRTRLFADVVTGQVDVRAIAASLPEFPELGIGLDSLLDDALAGGEE
ncbi:restriction endonuclease subunit S [Kocuria massiliensis]|uniref:restriction endonuclease subunit S n=1 Tax=Kocuria massiliensis TaxID=1926282 RepID=UPI000A1C8000|nr:restriction endonuclease subunit S [Kocuria massiliensis]